MVATLWVGALVVSLATSQTSDDTATNARASENVGWVRPKAKDLRGLFRIEFKRDLGTFELLKIYEEEWTRPYISKDGARLFVGTRSGRLLALDPSDGELLWQRRDMGTIGVGIAEFQGLVILGSDSDLVALDRATGKTRWKLDINGRIGGTISVLDGMAVVPVRPNAFSGIDLAKGEEVWRVQRQTPDGLTVRGQAPPTIDGPRGQVYLGFSDGALLAVDLEDGGNRWIVQLGKRREFFADVDAAPTLVEGGKALMAASYNGGLARINPDTGEVLLKRPELARLTGLAAVDRGLVVASYGDGQVLGLYEDSAQVRWRYRLKRGAPTAPVFLGDGYVMVGCTEGPIAILRTSTGEPVQVTDLSSGVSVSPFHRGRYLAAMANAGLLLVLKRRSNLRQ